MHSAMLAATPGRRYMTSMNRITSSRPIRPAVIAPSMASRPSVAEIARVSTSAMSSGSAPDWISMARLRDSSSDCSTVMPLEESPMVIWP